MIRLAAITMLWAGMACAQPTGVAEPLRIGTESDFAPYIAMNDAGQREGYDVDLMAAICERGPYDCTWVEQPFSDLFTGLDAGAYDIVIGGVGNTPDRAQFADWTAPYRHVETGRSSFAALSDKIDPRDVKVSVQVGTLQETELRKRGYDVVTYPSNTSALQAMLNGEIPVFFATVGYLQEIERNIDAKLFNLGDLTYPESGPQIGVQKTQTDLLVRLNEILADLAEDGTLDRLELRWFPSRKGKGT